MKGKRQLLYLCIEAKGSKSEWKNFREISLLGAPQWGGHSRTSTSPFPCISSYPTLLSPLLYYFFSLTSPSWTHFQLSLYHTPSGWLQQKSLHLSLSKQSLLSCSSLSLLISLPHILLSHPIPPSSWTETLQFTSMHFFF